MLQKFLIKGRFRRVLVVLGVLILLRATAFYSPPPIADFSNFSFQQWIFGPLLNHPYWALAFNLLFIAGLAFGFNYVLRFYRYVPFRSYTGALIFVLLHSHAPWLLSLHPLILPMIFLSICFIFSLRISNGRENYIQIYWAAFFTGLSALCYPLTGTFILYVFLVIMVNSILGWREMVITFLGFFNPILLVVSIIYLANMPAYLLWNQTKVIMLLPAISSPGIFEWAFIGLLAPLSIWVFFSIAGMAGKKSLTFRKFTWLHIWFLVISVISALWAGPFFMYYIALASIPLSSFLSVYYSVEKRGLKSEIVLIILVIIALIQNNLNLMP